VPCPLCRKSQLHVFDDPARNGHWLHCGGCDFTGTAIDLAAAHWKLSITQTASRLNQAGVLLNYTADERQAYIAVRDADARLLALWQASRRNLKNMGPTIQAVLTSFDLRCNPTTNRWDAGFGQLLGIFLAVDRPALAKLHRQVAEELGERSPRNWDALLALPYWAFPGRLAGLMAVGHEDKNDGKIAANFYQPKLLPVLQNSGSRFGREAGLFYHPAVLRCGKQYGHRILCTHNPLIVLRTQQRHFNTSTIPVPIAAFRATTATTGSRTQTFHAWRQLGKHKPVVWWPWFDPGFIAQALITGSLVSTRSSKNGGREFASLLAGLGYTGSYQQTVKRFLESATPWPKAFNRIAGVLPESQLNQLAKHITDCGFSLPRILGYCNSTVQARFADAVAVDSTPLSVPIAKQTRVTESQGSWYLFSGQYAQAPLIMDATLRIDEIHCPHRCDDTQNLPIRYAGEITYRDKVYPFCEDRGELEKNTWRWIANFLAMRGHVLQGLPNRVSDLLHIAMQLHPPKVRHTIDRVGWDAPSQQLHLAGYYFNQHGRPRLYEHLRPAAPAPGKTIPLPAELSPEEAGQLQSLTCVTRHCVLVFLANILAKLAGQATHGLAFIGTYAQQHITAMRQVFDCLEVDFTEQNTPERLAAFERKDDWMVAVPAVETNEHRQLLAEWLQEFRDTQHNVMAAFTQTQAKKLNPAYWQISWSRCSPRISQEQELAIQKLIAIAIQNTLTQHGVQMLSHKRWTGKTWLRTVTQGVAKPLLRSNNPAEITTKLRGFDPLMPGYQS